jgi:hypothetical protein
MICHIHLGGTGTSLRNDNRTCNYYYNEVKFNKVNTGNSYTNGINSSDYNIPVAYLNQMDKNTLGTTAPVSGLFNIPAYQIRTVEEK